MGSGWTTLSGEDLGCWRRPGEGFVPTSEDLFAAIEAGDEDAVAALVEADPRLATDTRAGVSPARAALQRGHQELAERLARAAAPLDVFDAAALGDVDALRDLLDHDADRARAISDDGLTPLHLAAYFRHCKSAEILLSRGADPDVAAADGTDLRPLHAAVAGGNVTIVHLLLDRGADVDQSRPGGYTPLHGAAASGDADLVRVLLERGADPTATTDEGQTAGDLTDDAAVLALLA